MVYRNKCKYIDERKFFLYIVKYSLGYGYVSRAKILQVFCPHYGKKEVKKTLKNLAEKGLIQLKKRRCLGTFIIPNWNIATKTAVNIPPTNSISHNQAGMSSSSQKRTVIGGGPK